MRALVLAAWLCCVGTARGVVHCAQRREVSPCSCRLQEGGPPRQLVLSCERVAGYARVAGALAGVFAPGTPVTLAVKHSDLADFSQHRISELGLTVTNLQLNNDNISFIEDSTFEGLTGVVYFSLADNDLPAVPRRILRHMPNIKTLDLGRSRIKILNAIDFKDVPFMHYLVLAGNGLTVIEKNSLPQSLRHLHLGVNHLTTLNGTLRNLDRLEWLFINSNKLTNIDNEIPKNANKLSLLHAANNQLEKLPSELRHLPRIDSLYFYHNRIQSLNGALQKSRRLLSLNLSFNSITHLAQDDFAEADNLQYMDLGYNKIQVLNGSLTPLRALKYLNLTHNELSEFSLQEIKGLQKLWVIDLSYNLITHLSGNTENLVDLETRLQELRLDHNRITNLGGALMGLHGLLRLNVSHNFLNIISPDNLIGLDELKVLDVSHNQITSLEELSKTYLSSLEELLASHNNLTMLDKDFHGLLRLCYADLSQNHIDSVNYDLVTKTNCSIHGVLGTLKINLHENPVLCGERFQTLASAIEKRQARILGTCPVRVSMLNPALLNDVMPDRRSHMLPALLATLAPPGLIKSTEDPPVKKEEFHTPISKHDLEVSKKQEPDSKTLYQKIETILQVNKEKHVTPVTYRESDTKISYRELDPQIRKHLPDLLISKHKANSPVSYHEPDQPVIYHGPDKVSYHEPTSPVIYQEPNPTVIYHEPNPPVIYHEPNPPVIYHDPNPPVVYHESNPPVVYHESNPPVVYHEPNLPVVYHEPNPPVMYHEPNPPVIYHEPVPVESFQKPETAVIKHKSDLVSSTTEFSAPLVHYKEPSILEPAPDTILHPYVKE